VLSTPSYLLALLQEILHIPRALAEIAEAERKIKRTGTLPRIKKKRVRKLILTFQTQDLAEFFGYGLLLCDSRAPRTLQDYFTTLHCATGCSSRKLLPDAIQLNSGTLYNWPH